MMGAVKPSKDQDLVVGYSKMDSKGKKKDKKPPDQKGDKSKSHEESSKSKKNKGKGEMSKCAYCGKGFNLEISCMNKQIDMLTQRLEKHNVSLPEGANKKEEGRSSEE